MIIIECKQCAKRQEDKCMASGRRSGSDAGKLLQKLGDTGKSVGSQASKSATHSQNSGGRAPGFVSSASRSGGPNNHGGPKPMGRPDHHGGPGMPPPPPRSGFSGSRSHGGPGMPPPPPRSGFGGPRNHGGPGMPPPPPRPPRDHRPRRTYGKRSLGSYIASIIVLVVILVIAYIVINF